LVSDRRKKYALGVVKNRSYATGSNPILVTLAAQDIGGVRMAPVCIVANQRTLARGSQSMCLPADKSGGHEVGLEFSESRRWWLGGYGQSLPNIAIQGTLRD
jgi:hypothetical protein